jgi:hypothetical protein
MVSAENNNAEILSTTNTRRFRIFIASPGDVEEERKHSREVIDKLRNEFRYKDRIKFEIVAWDQPGASVAQEATLTPQAAIAKGLPKPAECDVVVVVFWSRMGTPLPAEDTKADGSRYLSGTEWEFCNAMEGAKENGQPTVWIYRRTQVPSPSFDDPQYEEKKKQWNLVQGFFESFTAEDGAILGGVNTYNDPTEFEKQLDGHLRDWLERHLASFEPKQRPSVSPTKTTITWKGAPYPGLRAFLQDEAPIFFGRHRETKELLDMLEKPEGQFVAVVGASGSGKSSLVAAGLLPALKDNAIDNSSHWLPIRFKPAEIDDNPFMALAVQLAPLLEKHNWRAGELAAQLFEMPSLFTESLIKQVHDTIPDASDLLLVIDQFEELFTRCDSKYLGQFIDLVASATSAEDTRVVITMRADYYRNCVDWPALTALLNQGAYSLPVPGAAALLDVIREPARMAGLSFKEGLADRMLQDTGDAPGRLALMAFALEKLYDTGKADRCLTHEEYKSFGGVRGAIAQKADETCTKLKGQGMDMDAALGEVFRELTTIDPERNVATRKRASLERFTGDALLLTNSLVDARLLVSDRGVVEVAHEVLFESWPRLKDWIATVRDDLRLNERVQSEARAWADGGYDPCHLWSHERLEPVYEMFFRLGLNRGELDEPIKSFVRPEAERLLEELEKLDTSHYRRAAIGDRLNQIGDPREGVGINSRGVPQIKWIAVPAGHVVLEDNSGTRDVSPFYIAKYPVTYRQYRAFLEADDGYRNKQWWKKLQHEKTPGEQYRPIDNHPAEYVSWYDAMAFCRWLSARLGYEVRLPTEYEWQQAATNGNPRNEYPWGRKWDKRLANTAESRLSRTTAVGMYPLGATDGNLEGAMDMAGNVWEWCLNKYDKPDDTSVSSDENRVLRGGSWYYYQDNAYAAFRLRFNPDLRLGYIGFRLCCGSPIS